jgi:hypothetical protein
MLGWFKQLSAGQVTIGGDGGDGGGGGGAVRQNPA